MRAGRVIHGAIHCCFSGYMLVVSLTAFLQQYSGLSTRLFRERLTVPWSCPPAKARTPILSLKSGSPQRGRAGAGTNLRARPGARRALDLDPAAPWHARFPGRLDPRDPPAVRRHALTPAFRHPQPTQERHRPLLPAVGNAGRRQQGKGSGHPSSAACGDSGVERHAVLRRIVAVRQAHPEGARECGADGGLPGRRERR